MKKEIYFLFIIIIISSCSPGELIDKEKSDSYFKKSDGIYYSPHGNWFELGIDKCSPIVGKFNVLAQNIAKDNHHVFYKSEIQPHIDYNSFYIDKVNGYNIPKDKNNVYREGWSKKLKPISNKNIDTKSYVYLDNDWAKDRKNYYKWDQTLNVDYKTFKVLNVNYSKDKDSVYFRVLKEKTHISIASYKHNVIPIDNINIIIDSTLYKWNEKSNLVFKNVKKVRSIHLDVFQINKQIIFDTIIIDNLNEKADFFRPLYKRRKPTFYTDNSSVYYENLLIPDSDINTFKLTKFYRSHYSYDKNNVYYKNEKIKNLNPDKVIFLNENILKYNKSIYLNGKKTNKVKKPKKLIVKVNKPRTWTDGEFEYDENLNIITKQ